jgi:hypothetical protein
MVPADLRQEHFASYQPLARQVATRHLDILRELPLGFLPLLLAELIDYDVKFPPERHEVDAQLAFMRARTTQHRREVMSRFDRLRLTREMEAVDWVRNPSTFSEQLAAHLWTTGQVADFRTAAVEFLDAVRAEIPAPRPVVPRFVGVVIGQGVEKNTYRLFRKLRSQGTYFSRVKPEDGVGILVRRAASRARQHPMAFAHWYIDGGVAYSPRPAGVEVLAYAELDALRDAVVTKLRNLLAAGAGTEARRSALMKLTPADLGLSGGAADAVLNHFKVTVLSEGSGVQFFSTTFVQWAAREALRRAQPVTLITRFAARMTERTMNIAVLDAAPQQNLDAAGALVDADMAAYYTRLNQMRLPGAEESAFLVWFEGHSDALIVSPSVARGVESSEPIDMEQLLDRALA